MRSFALTVSLGLLLLPSSGVALTIVPNPVPLFLAELDGNIDGSVTLVEVVSGVPAGGVVTDGSVDPTDITLVLEFSVVESTPFDAWGIVEAAVQPAGGGTFLTIAGVGRVGAMQVLQDPDIFFNMIRAHGSLEEGQTSERIFVSYDALADDGSLELWVLGGESVNLATNTALIVPEPDAAAVMLVATVAIGAYASRWRRYGRGAWESRAR